MLERLVISFRSEEEIERHLKQGTRMASFWCLQQLTYTQH